MSIRIKSWGGIAVWFLRKRFSVFTSRIALKSADVWYRKKIKQYIEWFAKQEQIPVFQQVMLETVNKCNGTCAFCPANRRDEKRAFKKMSDEPIAKLLDELCEMQFQGNIYLSVNNEPSIDTRILKIAAKIKKMLPEMRICLITNGTLLTVKKMLEAASCIDNMIINSFRGDFYANNKMCYTMYFRTFCPIFMREFNHI